MADGGWRMADGEWRMADGGGCVLRGEAFRLFALDSHLMSAARIALALAILLWAGWELFHYLAIEPGRKEFAEECRAKGGVLTSGSRGQICAPKQ